MDRLLPCQTGHLARRPIRLGHNVMAIYIGARIVSLADPPDGSGSGRASQIIGSPLAGL